MIHSADSPVRGLYHKPLKGGVLRRSGAPSFVFNRTDGGFFHGRRITHGSRKFSAPNKLPIHIALRNLLVREEVINLKDICSSLKTEPMTLKAYLDFWIQRSCLECVCPVGLIVTPQTYISKSHLIYFRWKKKSGQTVVRPVERKRPKSAISLSMLKHFV